MLIYKISHDSLTETTYESFKNDDMKINKYWLILSPDELSKKKSHFHFRHQTINDCIHNDDAAKLEVYENYSFGILNIIDVKENFFKADELDFYLTKNFLMFVSRKDLNIFNEIKNDIYSKGSLSLSLENIMFSLFDKLTIKDYNELSNLEF